MHTRPRHAIALCSTIALTLSCTDATVPDSPLVPASQLAVATASADRTPPTAPSNLRVTAKTSFSVTLAWSPSSDNSGNFSYRVRHSWGYEVTVPRTQTSYTWTTNLEAGRSYSFVVYAVDAAGNLSRNSNTVNASLPADRQPPTAPVLTATDVGSTHVSLNWKSTDNGPFVFYTISVNGTPTIQGTSSTSGTIHLLQPSTTYTFTAAARDNGINWSPLSAPLVVTTRPRDVTDTTPPSTPTNLHADAYLDEITVRWNHATDDRDAQSVLRYDVYLNGVLADAAVGRTRSIIYGVNGLNTIELRAVDSAGNASPAARTTITLSF